MFDINAVNAETLTSPAGHYHHAACAGGLVFLSGLLPITPRGRKLTGESFDVQAEQVFRNMDCVLSACGCDKTRLVQVRAYLSDVGLWPRFDQLYARWMGDHRPARCVVPVPALHFGLDLEIEAVALQKPPST